MAWSFRRSTRTGDERERPQRMPVTAAGSDAMGGVQLTPTDGDAMGGVQLAPADGDVMGGIRPTPPGGDPMASTGIASEPPATLTADDHSPSGGEPPAAEPEDRRLATSAAGDYHRASPPGRPPRPR